LTLITCLAAGTLHAAEPSAKPTPEPTPYKFLSMKRHDEFLKIAKAGNVGLVFFGDSITDFWRRGENKAVWDKYFGEFKPANFGIGGDTTQGVLWRIQNGELEGIHPKLVVLNIGTNNNHETPELTAARIKEIIGEIQTRSPGTRILLMGIFPKSGSADRFRLRNSKVNEIISTYGFPDDPKRVIYIDIGAKFLNPDQSVNKELLPDTLHPNAKGFEVWAESIIETVRQQMK
jgi:lysophospholipase L1-like esterase